MFVVVPDKNVAVLSAVGTPAPIVNPCDVLFTKDPMIAGPLIVLLLFNAANEY